jgi:hypothetical protein
MNSEHTFDEAGAYRIQVKGSLDLKWEDWFDGFQITYTNGDTQLTGSVPDQAALHGILGKINGLGLILISVIRFPQIEYSEVYHE